ncbi:hypothetical protein C9374_005447 [Naegleria lovaniensis]|uniref:tRNA (guanine(26)-N(2))-dimethyltransferase n=1 Tax=Naegleria lovaniensis TaxID=51637 RepID=A0AA88GQJ1_NAELO|nr:uncharacterized protein C9374_005447 [Naegleria lovaniensis]KAG2382245.1 hypothetical protein C9374_005447 [Naegleria lovaniensis]
MNQDVSVSSSSSDATNNNTSTTLPSSTQLELIDGKYYPSGTHHNISNIKSIPSGYQCINEGTATVLYANDTEAFYNKVQVFNRDVSTLVIKMFNETRKEEKLKPSSRRRKKNEDEMDTSSDNLKTYEGLKILEALSATGLRSIRYWHEIPDVKQIIANDLLPEAVQVIKRNVEFNDISENCVTANQGDAIAYMASNSGKAFDVVDLDPYGSAAPFIDGAVQCVDGNGGLLCITCTDMAVLCGQQPGTCFAKYGSYPQKLKACHEQGLRMLISSVQNSASRYKRYVVPVLSLSVDFYVRVFLRVYSSSEKVKNIYKEMGNVFVCSGCEAFYTETFGGRSSANSKQFHEHGTRAETIPKEQCPECGWRLKLSGPMWLGPLHDSEFITKCLDHVQKNTQLFSTHKRIIGLLTVAKSELPDAPLYHAVDHISSVLKCMNPPMTSVKSALINAGFRVSQSHAKPNALKTDAPISFIYDVMKEWIKTNPVKPHKEDAKKTPGQVILEKPQQHTINFSVNEKALTTRKYTGIATFLPNPEENWGPGKRNTIHQSVKSSSTASVTSSSDQTDQPPTDTQPQTKKPKFD